MGRFLFVNLIFLWTFLFSTPITLNFDKLSNTAKVHEFYDGGYSQVSTGEYQGSDLTKGLDDYNVTFIGEALVSDKTISGKFNGNSSGNNIIFVGGDGHNKITINIKDGFSKGLLFHYSYAGGSGRKDSINIWSESNGTGFLLESYNLDDTSFNNTTEAGAYQSWKQKGFNFNGQAKSIVVTVLSKRMGFDDIIIGKHYAPIESVFHIDFSLYDKNNMDAVLHPSTDNISNTFKVILDVHGASANLCNQYKFKAIDSKGQTANATCQYIAARNLATTPPTRTPDHIELDFKITGNNGKYNLENAAVEICDKTVTPETCKKLNIIQNLTVHGTEFDITLHGYSFENGKWQQAINVTGVIQDRTNNLAYATREIQEFLQDKYGDILWKNVGHVTSVDLWLTRIVLNSNTSKGLCHGMALTSIANFNYRNVTDPITETWGTLGKIKEKWESQIINHWDDTGIKANAPYRPLSNYTYIYVKDNIEALKKILYYHVAQSSFKGKSSDTWIGKYKDDSSFATPTGKRHILKILKSGSPFSVGVFFKPVGGHALIATQYLEYNNLEKWYMYDSNYPKEYTYYAADNHFYTSNRILYRGLKIKSIFGDVLDDTLNIYKNRVPPFKAKVNSLPKQFKEINNLQKRAYTYIPMKHIKLHLVGATFKKLIDTSNNEEILPMPYQGKLMSIQAYQQNNNLFSNQIFLPKDKTYKVTVEKDKNFPFIKIFTTIPDKNGGVELIHYDNIEADENDSTMATFTIGINNKNKTLTRGDGTQMSPSYEESFRLKLTPATNANAIVKTDIIELTWQNPDNPNFKEVVIIRKEDNASTSVSDGEEVYRGSGEKFTDANIDADASYVYSIYAHDLNGDYAESTTLYVDTYRYSLYGTVLDESGNAVSATRVTLNAQSGRFINIASTDVQGLFSFNGMNSGDYNLAFTHNYYTFSKADMNVTVVDKSLKIDNVAEGKAALSIGMSQRLQAGEETDIAWAGLHISDGSKVDIILDKNGTSKPIASGVAFDAQHFNWMVESLEEDTSHTATVKVSLSSDPSVSAQRDVLILAKIKYAYDFNANGVIDNADIEQIASRWQAELGDENYASLYDLNKDGRIDIKDIMLVVHQKETL